MQRKSTVLKWAGSTACDALDGSNAPTGGMALLQNLIRDPSTNNYWQARPAAILINALTGAFTPGFVSVAKVIGNIMYGMVSDGGGLDKPFALNLITTALITVTGTQTSATLPATQTYPWVIPAQMDMIGTRLMVAHPGFSPTATASGNYFGWFDLTAPASPVWHAGQLTGGFITFSVPPIAVKQYYNRAYYIQNPTAAPAVIFSDVLNSINCTNANQILTFDDISPLTALGQLPLSTLMGGQLQALIVFKSTQAMYQITGDAALNNLQVNRLSIATGTQSPNSICPTPFGLAFVSSDGLRIIGFDAKVSDPIGLEGSGIVVPFQQAFVNSIAAACSSDVLRVAISSAIAGEVEYWYYFDAKEWTGPHTFAASLIWQWSAAGPGDTFLIQPNANSGVKGIWRSDYLQYSTSVFTENGSAILCKWQTVLLPDTEEMNNVCVTELTLDAALPSGASSLARPPLVIMNDQDSNALAPSVVLVPGTTAAVQPYRINWTKPLVFARASFYFEINGILGFSIGALRLRYQMLRSYQDTVISTGQAAQAYTFNPARLGTHATLSGGNLILTGDGTSNNACSLTTIGAKSGRYYAEFTLTVADPGINRSALGVTTSLSNVNTYLGFDSTTWAYFSDGGFLNNNIFLFSGPAFNTVGTVISIAFSATEGYVWFAVNGVWIQGNPVTSTSPSITIPPPSTIFLCASVNNVGAFSANFGASAFAYTPPQGFQAFNTINE